MSTNTSITKLTSLFSSEEASSFQSKDLVGNFNLMSSKIKASVGKTDPSTARPDVNSFTAEEVKELTSSNSVALASVIAGYVSAESQGNGYSTYATSRTTGKTLIGESQSNINMSEGFRGFRDNSDSVANFSQESFAPTNIGNMRKEFFEFNMRSAQQDEYNKEFWRLRMVAPGEHGVTYVVPKLTVRRERRMSDDATQSIYDRQRNVWDAVQDPSILEGDYLSLSPVRVTTGANSGYYPTLTYGTRVVDVLGTQTTTGPLLAKGADGNANYFNYLSLCRTGLAGAVAGMEGYDSIAPGAALSMLYFASGNADANVFGIKTLGLHRSNFNQSSEGSSKEANLMFRDAEIRVKISSLMNVSTGTPVAVAAFTAAALAGAEAVFTISADAVLNLESGMLTAPTVTSVKLVRIVIPSNVSGAAPTIVKSGADATTAGADVVTAYNLLVASFSVSTYKAFEIATRATNNSHRENGLIIEDRKTKMNFYVLPRTPFSIQSEITGQAGTTSLPIATASEVVRIRRNNDGVLQMFELSDHYARVIGSVADFPANGMRYPSALSSDLVYPYYMVDEFNVLDVYTNVQSANRDSDVSGALISYLKAIASIMIRDSHYGSTLSQKHPGEKPRVIIGTDPVTASYLVRSGDIRLFGDHIDVEVVSTDVKKHYGKIFMTLARKDRADGDFFSSGECIVAPDFVSTISPANDSSSRNAHFTTNKVQPAYVFVPILPILCDITILGLIDALSNPSVIQTEEQNT